jgi:hypothetical protein
MVKVKRIFAVIGLCLVATLVGYSWYTGSRLTNYPQDIEGYKNSAFYGKYGGMIAFTDGYAWYQASWKEVILLNLKSYENGVIIMMKDDKEYSFTAIDADTLFDEQRNMVLERRQGDG